MHARVFRTENDVIIYARIAFIVSCLSEDKGTNRRAQIEFPQFPYRKRHYPPMSSPA